MRTYYDLTCSRCPKHISQGELSFSLDQFHLPLCYNCQNWYRSLPKKPTIFAKELFLELRSRGIVAELEKDDGHKHIDIAVEHAKIYIEVDGEHHNTNSVCAISDLKRSFYSLMDGYITLRVPNSAIEGNLPETADYVSKIIFENEKRITLISASPQSSFQEKLYRAFFRQYYRVRL